MRCFLPLLIVLSVLCPPAPVWSQTPLKGRDATIRGAQTFAIIVGISKYKYIRPLTYADKDAELFRDYLKSPGGGSVKEENIFCLLNEKALNSNFWGKGFQWLKAKELRRGDRLFIYLAGHGDAIDEDQFFFLGYDCNPAGDKNNYLVAGAIQLFNLKKKIANETARGVEVVFIMDACRSNELPGGPAGLNFLNTAISEKKAGEIIMLATGAGQESLEDASIGNGQGLFTYYLVDGLIGGADSTDILDQKITFRELKTYVDKNVPSVAQQRFKRKQDPYFCCNENDDKTMSTVDTAYLRKWLRTKKQSRGPGNSFSGEEPVYSVRFTLADTSLVETYNLFNKAVTDKKITGGASAEFFYQRMNARFPGTPYTLDAKSTLAVEYINAAQDKINRYLGCGDDQSTREKRENFEAGNNLEKAIAMVREDDSEFANSLLGRMYFLKASGDFGPGATNGELTTAFQYAYAALSRDPNGAYIQNKLALLHLQNNRTDSARYYADKAVKTAPKWLCALTTLGLVQKAATNNNPQPENPNKTPKPPIRKTSFGFTLGGGLNQSRPEYSGNNQTGIIGVDASNAISGGLGVILQVNLGNTTAIRPAATVSVENMDIDFQRRFSTGGPVVTETVQVKTTSVNMALPLIIRLSQKNTAPYLALGPSFNYLFRQDGSSNEIVPVKKTVILGDAGLGVDIGLKSGFAISPEIKYTMGLSDMNDDATTTSYNLALSSLKRNAFVLSVYLRKR